MLSVVIAAHHDGRRLVATLAALVPGAIAGLVRDVVVVDRGSPEIAEITDAAGCQLMALDASRGAQLKAAAVAARAPWLLFLAPGSVPAGGWIAEVREFIETCELSGRADKIAAVFRGTALPGAMRPAVVEALRLLASSFGARPRPEQGLLIAKHLYEKVGGHRDDAEAEHALLRKLGRRRIVTLRSTAVMTGNVTR
jgi:hypothetical protein